MLLERSAASCSSFTLAREAPPGSSVLGLRVPSCCAVILLCRRNGLFLNQIWVRVY